jgi:hypothetical protein
MKNIISNKIMNVMFVINLQLILLAALIAQYYHAINAIVDNKLEMKINVYYAVKIQIPLRISNF